MKRKFRWLRNILARLVRYERWKQANYELYLRMKIYKNNLTL